VRDFATQESISEQAALEKGMEVKSIEFVKQGAEVYHKA
jgi:phosphomethylpyrimidine synthase